MYLLVLTFWQEFPEGSRYPEALLSKVSVFLESRVPAVQEWEFALLRLRLEIDSSRRSQTWHSVQCWQVARSLKCTCVHTVRQCRNSRAMVAALCSSFLVNDFVTSLMTRTSKEVDVARDSLEVLHYFASLPETDAHAIELSVFMPM